MSLDEKWEYRGGSTTCNRYCVVVDKTNNCCGEPAVSDYRGYSTYPALRLRRLSLSYQENSYFCRKHLDVIIEILRYSIVFTKRPYFWKKNQEYIIGFINKNIETIYHLRSHKMIKYQMNLDPESTEWSDQWNMSYIEKIILRESATTIYILQETYLIEFVKQLNSEIKRKRVLLNDILPKLIKSDYLDRNVFDIIASY